MNCPQCGATVFSFDVKCPKCGLVLSGDNSSAAANDPNAVSNDTTVNNPAPVNNAAPAAGQYRSRYTLFFYTWLGAVYGKHLKWLGFDSEAKQIRSEFGIGFSTIFNIPALIGSMVFQVTECFAVLFGKYPVDAQGVPVTYKKPKA